MSAAGHKLAREIIRKHGVDRYPAAARQAIKVLEEVGELLVEIGHQEGGASLAVVSAIRKEYGDAGLALHALGDKLGLDLDECMTEVVENETRRFA